MLDCSFAFQSEAKCSASNPGSKTNTAIGLTEASTCERNVIFKPICKFICKDDSKLEINALMHMEFPSDMLDVDTFNKWMKSLQDELMFLFEIMSYSDFAKIEISDWRKILADLVSKIQERNVS